MADVISAEYNAGFLAHAELIEGGIEIKNPHPKGSSLYDDWQTGFRHAVEDHEKLTKPKKKPLWHPCGRCQACKINFPKMCTSPTPA